MKTPLHKSLTENIDYMRTQTKQSADFTVREATLSGIQTAIVTMEGLVDSVELSDLMIKTFLLENNVLQSPLALYDRIRKYSLIGLDTKEIFDFENSFRLLMSGFAMILVDGVDKAFFIGAQGFPSRSVSEPSGETNLRGSMEGFIEPIKRNLTLIRRRIKSPDLTFEMLTLGTKSNTDVALIYLQSAVDVNLLADVKKRLSEVKMDVLLESGYLIPFLQGDAASIFTDVGTTERPDTVCAKINEGRIAILVDGTPYALITPYLFTEHFQSVDDYSHRPYYTTFIRVLKYFSFVLTILLPGLYVAAATFHPEVFPSEMLYNIASAQETTPFPLLLEALMIHFIFEVMREAGLRLPKQIGHAVSIIGGLVIGTAAVTAGLIGTPMLMIVAVTAISSFVVPSIYEPVAILRFVFILLGGWFGFYGIAIGLCLMLVNVTRLGSYGVPYTAPILPFSIGAMRDTVYRASWKTLQKRTARIQSMHGVHIHSEGEEKD